jgi:hypothetical protein
MIYIFGFTSYFSLAVGFRMVNIIRGIHGSFLLISLILRYLVIKLSSKIENNAMLHLRSYALKILLA